MKYIVYCTTNLINKHIYIGVHQCTSNKFDGYIGCGVYVTQPSTYNHPKTAFQFAVQKYGPSNFKRVTIKEYDNAEDAYFLESELVNKEYLKRKDVYNEVIGGRGGDLVNNAIPCYQYDLEGNYLREFESQQKAAIYVERGFSTIKSAIRDKVKSANSYWSLEKVEKLDLSQFKTTSNRIPIFQYSETGEYDCCYESVSDAARVNEVASTAISRSCKLGYKCKNKYFSYEFSTQFSKAKSESIKNRKIYQYSLEGKFIAEFSSCSEAERALNVKRGLSTAIRLGRIFAGFQWKLEKLDKIDSVIIKSKARKVGQYDLEGNLIKTFDTVTECQKQFSGCKHVLHGKRKTSGGFIFKYIE